MTNRAYLNHSTNYGLVQNEEPRTILHDLIEEELREQQRQNSDVQETPISTAKRINVSNND